MAAAKALRSGIASLYVKSLGELQFKVHTTVLAHEVFCSLQFSREHDEAVPLNFKVTSLGTNQM